MPLEFTKMHALGNDYVYVCTYRQRVDEPAALARRIADRHRGVGGDGLILIAPPESPDAHVRMVLYNADGSRGQMCGNGIRCVAKYAYERGLARVNPMRVQTDHGLLTCELRVDAGGCVEAVRVDMGPPILDPARIPVALPGERIVDVRIQIEGLDLPVTCVSLGNPHAVFFVPDVGIIPLGYWGPRVERSPLFPQRTNVHFVQVLAPQRLRMVTWERGSGITQACGTGASAACVAGVLTGRAAHDVTVDMPGGQLAIAWDARTRHVFMTGSATEVFTGSWPD
ncbi:MAG: diaminopimelate epimerase [Phycisphaerales bacterium]|nr:diaminopimelate epimerase [Phycisphaerales bacterium]